MILRRESENSQQLNLRMYCRGVDCLTNAFSKKRLDGATISMIARLKWASIS
jgi:hypothetical protein